MTDPRTHRLHERHEALGASFTDFAGWLMPVRYSSDLAEHHAVRTAAGLFDISHMAEILVDGRGRRRVPRLRARRPALGDRDRPGEVLAAARRRRRHHRRPHRLPPRRRPLHGGRERGQPRCRRRGARATARRASTSTVDDATDDIALIAVQGPRRAAIVDATAGHRRAPAAARRARSTTAIDRTRLPATGATAGARSRRTGYTGEDGFELYVAPRSRAGALGRAARRGRAARARARRPRQPATRCASRRACRCTATSSSLDIVPAQAGLGRVVAARQGATSSAAPASRRSSPPTPPCSSGSSRRAGAPAAPGTRCSARRRRRVGVITSGALSPTLGHPIAMAYVAPARERARHRTVHRRAGDRIPAHRRPPCPSTGAPHDQHHPSPPPEET